MSETFEDWAQLERHLLAISSRFQERWQSPTGHDCLRFAYAYAGDDYGVFFVHNELDSGASWVFIGVRVAAASRFDLRALMREVPRGSIGGLSLAHDYVCVSHNLPIRGLRADDLRFTLDELCELAKYCVSRAASTAIADATFAHLAD